MQPNGIIVRVNWESKLVYVRYHTTDIVEEFDLFDVFNCWIQRKDYGFWLIGEGGLELLDSYVDQPEFIIPDAE